MAVIFPAYGKQGELARTLLALADDPLDVKTNTDNGFAFLVSEELYERYLDSLEPKTETPADVEKAARRPGRPRKAAVPAAENEGE